MPHVREHVTEDTKNNFHLHKHIYAKYVSLTFEKGEKEIQLS
jgi:hypothetical protein